MRNEKEVINQILDFANSEDRIQVVVMNGSRVNPNAPKDIMMDYDVALYIKDIRNISYKLNQEWINRFGDIVIMQQNDFEHGYVFLMQFKDGVRIDLSFLDINLVNESIENDTLTKVLLDKNNLVKELPVPHDSGYYVKRPTEKEFDEIMNELWWIQTYIAKGIWRDELPLVKYMFDVILMDCIRKMISWHIGNRFDWKINSGKMGKWFKHFLSEELYNEFILLYPSTDYEAIWQSLFNAGELIRMIGTSLAKEMGYRYPLQDDINVTEYLHKIKALSRDAKDF